MLETEPNNAENESGKQGSTEAGRPVGDTLAASPPAAGPAPAAGTAADGKRGARASRTRRASTRATRPAGPPSGDVPPPAVPSAEFSAAEPPGEGRASAGP